MARWMIPALVMAMMIMCLVLPSDGLCQEVCRAADDILERHLQAPPGCELQVMLHDGFILYYQSLSLLWSNAQEQPIELPLALHVNSSSFLYVYDWNEDTNSSMLQHGSDSAPFKFQQKTPYFSINPCGDTNVVYPSSGISLNYGRSATMSVSPYAGQYSPWDGVSISATGTHSCSSTTLHLVCDLNDQNVYRGEVHRITDVQFDGCALEITMATRTACPGEYCNRWNPPNGTCNRLGSRLQAPRRTECQGVFILAYSVHRHCDAFSRACGYIELILFIVAFPLYVTCAVLTFKFQLGSAYHKVIMTFGSISTFCWLLFNFLSVAVPMGPHMSLAYAAALFISFFLGLLFILLSFISIPILWLKVKLLVERTPPKRIKLLGVVTVIACCISCVPFITGMIGFLVSANGFPNWAIAFAIAIPVILCFAVYIIGIFFASLMWKISTQIAKSGISTKSEISERQRPFRKLIISMLFCTLFLVVILIGAAEVSNASPALRQNLTQTGRDVLFLFFMISLFAESVVMLWYIDIFALYRKKRSLEKLSSETRSEITSSRAKSSSSLSGPAEVHVDADDRNFSHSDIGETETDVQIGYLL